MNSRLDEFQAAILKVRLTRLTDFTARRREIAGRYLQAIDHDLINHLARPQEAPAHVYHLFVVTCERREALETHLANSGVQTYRHYPVPVHYQEKCKDMGRDPKGLIKSERHAKACLSLPCHPQMRDEDVDIVIDAVKQFKG